MKSFEIKALGLEDLATNELCEINGGGKLGDAVKAFLQKWKNEVTVVAVLEWINNHWNALVDGFIDGSEYGAGKYIESN